MFANWDLIRSVDFNMKNFHSHKPTLGIFFQFFQSQRSMKIFNRKTDIDESSVWYAILVKMTYFRPRYHRSPRASKNIAVVPGTLIRNDSESFWYARWAKRKKKKKMTTIIPTAHCDSMRKGIFPFWILLKQFRPRGGWWYVKSSYLWYVYHS